jgi:hypothetical protein
MKYGQIAGSKRVNATIYRCFDYISEEDARKFVKKFRDQLQDDFQVMHTFRELILGAYLVSNGFVARYDRAINADTPDWCLLDKASTLKGVIELTNFHSDKATETEIERQVQINGMWYGRLSSNEDRLYHCIWHKVQKYKALVEQNGLPYVIAVFGEFTSFADLEEVRQCLFRQGTGLFALYPTISGVLYFEENAGKYPFTYIPNPGSSRALDLPSGAF